MLSVYSSIVNAENPRFPNTEEGEDKMVNLIVVIIVGAIIGWVASVIMRTRGGLLVDIVVGIVGALLAGYLFKKALFTAGNFSIESLLLSLLGAVILLALFKLIFRAMGR
jgi:uncharacterized membrane protein YeaQ/YmgE (transglycosylase-associated protein family)